MLSQITDSLNLIAQQTKANAGALCVIISILVGVFVVNTLLHGRLFILGIIPRRMYGLLGIIFAPFLHANANHLFFNSIPLLVLSNFLLMQGIDFFLLVTLEIMIISGFLIWCFGKPGIHLGASAVITGYWGLLVINIYSQGTVTAIILGIICLYYFAGIFFSIFPSEKGVSWEGHLFGLFAGLLIGAI